jgi:cytochrome P450
MQIDFTRRPGDGLPLYEYERIRAEGPVAWSDSLNGWVVSPYEEVKGVLSDLGHFTSEGAPISEAFAKEAMLTNDTPLHNRMRAVWAEHVSKSAMATREARLREMADAALAPVKARLKTGEPVDLIGAFEGFVADAVIWLFGTPPERRADILRWHRMFSETPALALDKDSPAYAAHEAAKAEVYDFLGRQMEDRRRRIAAGEQPEDPIGRMTAAEGHGSITHSMAIDNLMNFFTGAIDTTVKWMGNVVAVLHRHPDALERVTADRSLLPQTFEEVMRYETVAQVLMRLVKRERVLAGKELRVGQSVFLLLGVANRDPAIYQAPDRFDIFRHAPPHLGFGFGMHHCLGVNIARQETLSLTNAMLDMLPALEIVDCDYGSGWALWGPRSLQVRLAAGV